MLAVKSTKKDFESKIKKVGHIEDIQIHESDTRGVVSSQLFFNPKHDIIPGLNEVIREAGWDIMEFHPEKLSLEDSFLLLTEGGSEEEKETVQEKGGAA
jgi:hypothetical protein